MATLNHIDPVAFAAYLDYEGDDDCLEDAAESFQDHYAGTYLNLATWTEEYADETGMLADVPESLRNYFDFDAWSRDAELNGDVWTVDLPNGSLAVFWR